MDRFKITYKRGHGPGGQHKNKVETCVVVTDPVTGMTEVCQKTPSQSQNKALAIARLTFRVIIQRDEMAAKVLNTQRLKCMETGVIRTYNYARGTVKDVRSRKTAPLKKVLNGNIDLLR